MAIEREQAHDDAAHEPVEEQSGPARLEILKALGDNTRYAVFLEIARSAKPLATADVARSLGLHPNTVRPHLERMRELGLLDQRVDARGGPGRPQHLYTVAPDAPSLGLEPPAFPRLARMLLQVAAGAGVAFEDAVEVGREQGTIDATRRRRSTQGVAALRSELSDLGFDPEDIGDDDGATIAFMHCPFRELAQSDPALVCGLHRGMVEGFVDAVGGACVTAFRTLVDRDHPCQVDLSSRPEPEVALR